MRAAGYWAWWNQNGDVPMEKCIQRAHQLAAAGGGGVIVKWGFWDAFDRFRRAGVRVAIERYVYPGNAAGEAQHLAEGIRRGAEFAVINAEAEWETGFGGPAMRTLVTTFDRECPGVEIYASVDTRGYRFARPFQRELAKAAALAGWMPEIYPKAFESSSTLGAFNASLYGKDFEGKPVLPTIQTYDGPGVASVIEQIAEVRKRGFPGCQAYTIAHATDDEWAAFVAAIPKEDEIDMATAAQLEEQIATLRRDTQIGLAALGGAVTAIKGWIWEHASDHGGAAPTPMALTQRLTHIEEQIAKAGQALGG